MKVALLTNFIPPYRKSLFRRLSERVDHLKILVSVEMEANRHWQVDHSGLEVAVQKTWSFKQKWKPKNGFQEESFLHIPYDTLAQLRRFNPDVVISAELGMRSLLAALYCRMAGKPLVLWLTLSERTESNKGGIRLRLRKFLLASAHTLLCNGKSAERYVRQLGYDKESFFVPYTSDYPLNSEPPKAIGTVRQVLFTGMLIDRKGVKEMVDALEAWAQQDSAVPMHLKVAGDGPEKVHFKRLDGLKILTYECLGSVPYAEVGKLYRESDLYLFPTLADEWGVVVNEALASGLPVLGSRYSQAVEELIRDGYNGWLFKPDNTDDFIRALNQSLATAPDQREQLYENCQKSIQDITPEKVALQIEEALKHVSKIKK